MVVVLLVGGIQPCSYLGDYVPVVSEASLAKAMFCIELSRCVVIWIVIDIHQATPVVFLYILEQ